MSNELALFELSALSPTAEWAERINEAWQSTVVGIFETGRRLNAAKDDIRARFGHGAWLNMVERELVFKPRTAQMLMKVADDPRLTNANHGSLLPPSWRTLYELTKLPDDVFEAKVADGSINPEMQRKDVAKENRRVAQKRDEERVASLEPVAGRFRALVVDPPWDYEWLSLAGRAAPGYATMSHDELLALDVAQWSEPDSHLYLWTTNNFMTRAVDLMAAWGWQHKTVLTWVKPRWGLGSYFRNSTEHCLFGVRGELRTRSDSIATHFQAPLGEHSEKPEAFYDIVRAASHGPFGELFQRQERPDFTNLVAEREALEA